MSARKVHQMNENFWSVLYAGLEANVVAKMKKINEKYDKLLKAGVSKVDEVRIEKERWDDLDKCISSKGRSRSRSRSRGGGTRRRQTS